MKKRKVTIELRTDLVDYANSCIVDEEDLSSFFSRLVEGHRLTAEEAHAGTKYFAFGSNMSKPQMKRRCPTATFHAVGVLRDHSLAFNRKGEYRPGSVASIVPSSGDRVYGVIWSLSDEDMRALDEFENLSTYERHAKCVHTLDGHTAVCNMYVSIPEGEYAPDKQYLDLMITAATDMGLPPEYIEQLRQYRK